jgi:DNA-binding transcriptional MerR regulator
MDGNSKYRIRQVAKILNIPVSTIKHHESIGRLPLPRRDQRGWRYYTDQDIVRIKAFFLDGRS